MTTGHDRASAGQTRTAATILTVALLTSCSAQPAKQADTNGAAAKTATASSATARSPETTVSKGSNAESTGKVPSGYRRITRNGRELFCRKVVTLGSRFPEQMCFTREQLDEIATRTGETMQNMERSKAVCTGGTQCAGT